MSPLTHSDIPSPPTVLPNVSVAMGSGLVFALCGNLLVTATESQIIFPATG